MPTLRDATTADAAAIAAIYNHEILHSTSTFDTTPVDADDRRAWLEAHSTPQRSVLVLEDEEVVGWASLSAWSDRCAYARAAEVSIYIHADHRGRGHGRSLLTGLIERAREAGIAVLLARICTEGEASIVLHRKLGFSSVGCMRRVGEKFGRVLDVELMDLSLEA